MHRIIIFASGSGTNAQRIIEHFHAGTFARVIAIYCNRPDAPVIGRAGNLQVPVRIFTREELNEPASVGDELKHHNPDIIVLAGFLWLIPQHIVKAYPHKIINIHPALLPAHGGKGMYGEKVHRAVLDAGDRESGITIHYADDVYDRGAIIFQATCAIEDGETPQSLAAKVHALEYRHYPAVIERVLAGAYPGEFKSTGHG